MCAGTEHSGQPGWRSAPLRCIASIIVARLSLSVVVVISIVAVCLESIGLVVSAMTGGDDNDGDDQNDL